ncbi:alpha/beta hydrolase [Streptomyces sp. CBMA152]|uniref:alpha/beta hydrolase n=1 Tax=Streptomyces sp. CBMA152 TaxID=1896312 RepID=UPI0016609934|nr:alpha/beta hydrolase [Streptomyces sp. CBMA152]
MLEAASGTPGLTWAPILPTLALHTRVIVYDRAGLGLSDPVKDLTVESSVQDLTALLSDVTQEPSVLVGNSWGGLLAQQVAWTAPALISGLVLVDPAHEEFRPWIGRVADTMSLRFLSARKALGLAEPMLRKEAVQAAQALTSDPRTQNLLIDAHMACHGDAHHIRTALAENRVIERHMPVARQMRASSPLPAVPVSVLSATLGLPNGMRTRWTALQAQIAAAADQGQHIEVHDAGHYIHRSQPEAVAKAVLAVVEQARLQ